jgi:CRP/FNR family transcriptional regulator, cyclic AMP receptor protein
MTAQGIEPARAEPAGGGPGRALLQLDPDLGQLLSPERRASAERELRVRVTTFPVGEWDGGRLADADPSHLGLLLVEGVLARELVLSDTVSTELLGPGDIVRPWHVEGPPELLPVEVRWNALAAVRLGLIDRRVAAQLGRYPEIGAVIVDRIAERAHRLAITQAISQLNRVDRRLLALFWHLAERWGRVSSDGIVVPLALSHRLIGELVGARRPTVSTALADLARNGQLVRREDGTWLLTGEPVAETAAAAEVVRQRRRLMPETSVTPVAPVLPSRLVPAGRGDLRLADLRASLAAAREAANRNRAALEQLADVTSALQQRTVQLRAERAQRLDALREAAARRGAARSKTG